MHFSTLPPRPLEHTVKSLQGKDFSLIGCECYWLYRQLSKHKTKPNLTSNFITIQSKGLWAVELNKQLRKRHFLTSFRTPPESRIQTAPPISNTLTLEGAQVMHTTLLSSSNRAWTLYQNNRHLLFFGKVFSEAAFSPSGAARPSILAAHNLAPVVVMHTHLFKARSKQTNPTNNLSMSWLKLKKSEDMNCSSRKHVMQ